MDRIDNGVGSLVMGMFQYSSFVGTTNQIAKPARANGMPLAWISHTPRVTARRYPVFESIINLLQEVGPRSEGDSLFFGLPVRYCARARSN